MTDAPRPVTRVRRPTLAKPADTMPIAGDDGPDIVLNAEREAAEQRAKAGTATLQDQANLDQARHHDALEAEAIREEARGTLGKAEATRAASRAELPPTGGVREEIRREGHAVARTPGFVPRDGDVLVLTYAEVTLPLPKAYSTMRFGGYTYSRKLAATDDVEAEAKAIAEWLTRRAESDGVAKYKRLVAEFKG